MQYFRRIKELTLKAGYILGDKQIEKLDKFTSLLLYYNEQFNLTAITGLDDIIIKHYIDSFSGAEFITENNSVIDIGSGAGFPSIPLKILLPGRKFVLLDSLDKRIGFLNTVIQELQLEDIETEHIRIEDAGNSKKYRENFDFVIARAVAPMNTLIEYALPLLKVGGKLIAYKGDKAAEELAQAENALQKLYGELEIVKEVPLMGQYDRNIVVVRKNKKTPCSFPRQQNKPKKNPL